MALPITRAKALREWRLYFFVLPSLALVGVFAYFPAASAIYHSFFDWQGGDNKQFIGWSNFHRIGSDRVLWSSFFTVGALIVFNLIKMIPSIAMAVAIPVVMGWRVSPAARHVLASAVAQALAWALALSSLPPAWPAMPI